MSRNRAAPAAREMLERVQLDHLAERMPAMLSGAAAARGAGQGADPNPRVLLLDEPLSALDEFLRLRMRGESSLQNELSIRFVHVTHPARGDCPGRHGGGRWITGGSTRRTRRATSSARPATPYVARFMGGQNVLSGTVTDADGGVLAIADPSGPTYAAQCPRPGAARWHGHPCRPPRPDHPDQGRLGGAGRAERRGRAGGRHRVPGHLCPR
ncbi:MAG: hypothetical protein R3C69_12965 [Geminicoccaceae bacterium]